MFVTRSREVREEAIALRRIGWSLRAISAELGVARSRRPAFGCAACRQPHARPPSRQRRRSLARCRCGPQARSGDAQGAGCCCPPSCSGGPVVDGSRGVAAASAPITAGAGERHGHGQKSGCPLLGTTSWNICAGRHASTAARATPSCSSSTTSGRRAPTSATWCASAPCRHGSRLNWQSARSSASTATDVGQREGGCAAHREAPPTPLGRGTPPMYWTGCARLPASTAGWRTPSCSTSTFAETRS